MAERSSPREQFARMFRREAELVGFQWRVFVIVMAACLAIMLPLFHRDEGLYRALQALGGQAFSEGARRLGFDLRFVLRGLAPVVVLLVMRERLRDHGLGLGKVKLGLRICGVAYLVYLPCFALLLASGEFRHFYGGAGGRHDGWASFLGQQVPYFLIMAIPTEFLYRGFLLLGVARHLGPFAGMMVSILPYALIHYGRPEIEALGSIPVGLALSWIALRTGSIWYGVLLHASIAIGINAALFAFA